MPPHRDDQGCFLVFFFYTKQTSSPVNRVVDGQKQSGFKTPQCLRASKFWLSIFQSCHVPICNVVIILISNPHPKVARRINCITPHKALEQFQAHCKYYSHDYYVSMAAKMYRSTILMDAYHSIKWIHAQMGDVRYLTASLLWDIQGLSKVLLLCPVINTHKSFCIC